MRRLGLKYQLRIHATRYCCAMVFLCGAELWNPRGSQVYKRQKVSPGEDGSNHTAQVGPGDGGRKKKKRNKLDLISKLFFSRNELARPVMRTIFLVNM